MIEIRAPFRHSRGEGHRYVDHHRAMTGISGACVGSGSGECWAPETQLYLQELRRLRPQKVRPRRLTAVVQPSRGICTNRSCPGTGTNVRSHRSGTAGSTPLPHQTSSTSSPTPTASGSMAPCASPPSPGPSRPSHPPSLSLPQRPRASRAGLDTWGFSPEKRRQTIPGIEFAEVRAMTARADVLGLFGLVPCEGSGDQVRGSCAARHATTPSGRRFSTKLGLHVDTCFTCG
jgi:hypothetical protein